MTNSQKRALKKNNDVVFLPIMCGEIDIAAIERDRDQIWAEAVHLYKAGEWDKIKAVIDTEWFQSAIANEWGKIQEKYRHHQK